MLLYKDVFTNDELFTDTYTMKLVDDCYYEIDGKITTEKEAEDYNIGANPSAEGGDEDIAATESTGIDIVLAHRLLSTPFNKKQFSVFIKGFMKRLIKVVEENNPERVESLKGKLAAKVKDILANFNDYDFYQGESMNTDGAILLLNYREDGITPFFTVFKDSVICEKL